MAQNINHQYSEETTEIITKPLPQHNRRRNPESELEKRLQRAMNAGRIFSWEMNPETREVEWSNNIEAVIGFPLHHNIDKTLELIHPEDFKSMVEQINEAIETGGEYESEYRLVNPENNEVFWFHSNGAMTADLADGTPLFCGVTQNITERKRAEEALRESEEQSRLLIEGAVDFAILKVNPDGLIASWNSGAEKVFGYAESEIVGQPLDIIFTPEDREKGVPQKDLEMALEKGCAEDERWHLRKDGSRFFASGVLNTLKEGAEGFVKIARDQTKRLEAEKAQRDKEILQRLAQAQEDERRRFSRDLHDELGQQLTTLRMKIEQVRILCEDNRELCAKIDETQSIVQSLDDGVDFLAWELRPSLLDDLGLFAAIDKYVKEWSQYSGIPADFVTSHQNGTRFAFETETNLYRIAQEALNNTHKHAQAKKAEVILNLRDDSVVLIIEDDGDGFNTKDKKTRSKGLGLLGIKERATLLGGNIEIESAPKQGTSIFIRVPITNTGENRSKSKQ